MREKTPTAPSTIRRRRPGRAVRAPGPQAIGVQEVLTRQRNLDAEAIATSTPDMAAITMEPSDPNLDIPSSAIRYRARLPAVRRIRYLTAAFRSKRAWSEYRCGGGTIRLPNPQ